MTRFAPSPSGPLHIGHAFSALTAHDRAQGKNGIFLLRIEDIDGARCRPEFEQAIFDDLAWLGIGWPVPVLRQSERYGAYRAALKELIAAGICYPCRCTRGDIRAAVRAPQEGMMMAGPDGPVYPGTCRDRPMSDAAPNDAIRLNMSAALELAGGPPEFNETGPLHNGHHKAKRADLMVQVGDIVLARRDISTSYHLAVVIDDAEQMVTEVVRGADLYAATAIHVLLQNLLELRTPTYYHHKLIRDERGKRLAKRDDARALATYRREGASPRTIRALLGI